MAASSSTNSKAQQFISGSWSQGAGAEAFSSNPAKPDEIVAKFHHSSEADISAALDAAKKAQSEWENLGIIGRGIILRSVADVMQGRRDSLAALMTREQGKTLAEALGEVDGSIETIRYHAASSRNSFGATFPSSFPGEHIEVVREALGVVAVITPWNFPTQIPAWKIAPALLWGNTVVWKPASDVPALSSAFVEAFQDGGLPAGVLNMVLAPGRTAQALVDSQMISGISFTGSVPVGNTIARSASDRGVKIQLELGGHNPAIVMPDVDPDFVATQLVVGAMSGSGQKCTATRRIITVGKIHAPFLAALAEKVDKLVVGDGSDPSTTTGPVVSASAKSEIESAIADAVAQGGRIVARSKVPEGPGHFVAPTVIEGNMELRTCKEEVFGPVTTVMNVDSLDEALLIANATEFGLTASFFSSSDADIARATKELVAGLIKINAPNTGSELHVPFGGLKASTFPGPREQNAQSVADFFTITKSVYRRIAPRGKQND